MTSIVLIIYWKQIKFFLTQKKYLYLIFIFFIIGTFICFNMYPEYLKSIVIPWLTLLVYICAIITLYFTAKTYFKKERRAEILLIEPMAKILNYINEEQDIYYKQINSCHNIKPEDKIYGTLNYINITCQFVKNVLNVQEAVSFKQFCLLSNVKLTIIEDFDKNTFRKILEERLIKRHGLIGRDGNNILAWDDTEIFCNFESLMWMEQDFKLLKLKLI
jgi:hypothetical protein